MTEIDPHATPNSKIVIVDGMFYEKTSQNTTRPSVTRDISEFPELCNVIPHMAEYLKNGQMTKVFFDCEEYHTTEEDGMQRATTMKNEIYELLNGFGRENIAIASRHGWVKKKTKKMTTLFKVSYRVILLNVAMPYTHTKTLIANLQFPEYFDISVYKSSEQLIGMTGCSKTTADKRVMKPETDHEYKDFVVQYLSGNEMKCVCYDPTKCEQDVDLLENVESTMSDGFKTVNVLDFDTLEFLVMALPVQFYGIGTYDNWKRVIIIIRNVSIVNDYLDRGLQLATKFSKQSSTNFNYNMTYKLYNMTTNHHPIGFPTLVYWLKRYNRPAYDQYMQRINVTEYMFQEDPDILVDPTVDHTVDPRPNVVSCKQMCDILVKPHIPYASLKQVFEQFHFKVKNPGGYAINDIDNTIRYVNTSQLRDIYSYVSVDEETSKGPKKVSFIDKWIKDNTIRMYTKMDIIPPPLNCPDYVYNTWKGFAIQHALTFNKEVLEQGSCDLFLNHVDIMANHCTQSSKYMLDWFAHMFQKPGELTHTALCFASIAEGIGKNVLVDMIVMLLGSQYYTYTNNPEQVLFDRHSDGLNDKLLVNIDESSRGELAKHAGRIKSELTCSSRVINPKGMPPITKSNFVRFILTTNVLSALPITAEDRRWVVFEPSSEKRGDHEYFSNLIQYMRELKNQKAIYDFLMARDIQNINWRTSRPITELYRDIQRTNNDSVLDFFVDICKHNIGGYKQHGGHEMFELYADYMKCTNSEKYTKQYKIFMSDIKAYARNSNGAIKHCVKKNKQLYFIDVNKTIEYLRGMNAWDDDYMFEDV